MLVFSSSPPYVCMVCTATSIQVGEISRTGQIQLPVWSPDGKMMAFSVLKAGSGGAPIESAKILVYRESGSLVVRESAEVKQKSIEGGGESAVFIFVCLQYTPQ